MHQTVCAVHIPAALGLKFYVCSLKCCVVPTLNYTIRLKLDLKNVSQKNRTDHMWESLSTKECFGDHLLKTGLIFLQRFKG